ncbi:MAG: hypothetical protein ACJ8F7_13045 [Gemmataceae bacterium]
MRCVKTFAASAALILTASIALAQAPGAGTPGQNSNPSAGSRPPQAQYNIPSPLYRQDDIGRSLNLTPEQINRLNRATESLQTRYGTDFERLGTLSDRERGQRYNELMRNYYSDWNKATNDIFNDQQRTRYGQLELQYRGIDAFSDPDLQRRLNLTDEQRTRLRDLDTWNQQQMQGLPNRMRTAGDRGADIWSDYRKQSSERLNQILTPEQRQTWSQLTGEAYNFRPPVSNASQLQPPNRNK